MKKILFLLLSICLTAQLSYGQTIICEKQGSTAAQLGEGNAAVTFVSTQPDWVITPIKGDVKQPKSKTSDGKKFVYEFRMDVSRDHERTYILGRKGSAITEQCVVKSLRPGIRVTFNLEEHADTLHRIEAKQASTPGVYPVEGKACVEITTSVKKLEVITRWEKEEKTSANGARVINVIVDVKYLGQLEVKRDSLAALMKYLEDADDYEKMETVMETINNLEEEYNALAELNIGGRGIKSVPIQLTDLSVKEKRRYAVVSITETFETFLAKAREFFVNYPSHTESSFYDAAKIAYDNAIKHNDCPFNLRDSLRAEYDLMADLRRNTYLVEAAEKKAKEFEREKGFDSDEVFKYLGGEIGFIDRILKAHPEMAVFNSLRSDVAQKLGRHPKSKIKDGEEVIMRKRETISGTVSFKNEYMAIPFERMKIYATSSSEIKNGQSRMIGKVNADGTFNVVKPDGINPLYIYVSGEKDDAHYVSAGTTSIDIIVK